MYLDMLDIMVQMYSLKIHMYDKSLSFFPTETKFIQVQLCDYLT